MSLYKCVSACVEFSPTSRPHTTYHATILVGLTWDPTLFIQAHKTWIPLNVTISHGTYLNELDNRVEIVQNDAL